MSVIFPFACGKVLGSDVSVGGCVWNTLPLVEGVTISEDILAKHKTLDVSQELTSGACSKRCAGTGPLSSVACITLLYEGTTRI